MKHADLYAKLHEESSKLLGLECISRARLVALQDEYRLPVERKILGVATLFQREFEYTFNSGAHVAQYKPAGFDCSLHFFIKMGTIESWAAVAPILEALALTGFDVDKWETTDHAETYTRSYKYKLAYAKWDEPDASKIGDVIVELAFNLPGDTDTCRRVLKGYSPTHSFGGQPQYELVCDKE